MKKTLAMVLALILTLSITISASAATEITFWNGFTGSDGEVLAQIVNDFNATNDKGIKVTMDVIPWANFHEKLPTAIATGTAPELVLMGNDAMMPYISTDSLLSLDDFFTATGMDRAEFPDSVLDMFNVNGTQYMMPMQVNTLYLYWNKTLFREAGLDPETPPTTWDELYAMAKKLTNPEKNIYGFALPVSSVSVFLNEMLSEGGAVVDDATGKCVLNSEANQKVFQQIQDAVQKDKISPLGTTGADFDNILFAGQLAMYINGPWCINGCNTNGLDYGVVKIPSGSAGRVYDMGGCGYGVTAGTSDEKKAACYEFIKYWNSTAVCKKWSMVNGFPPYLASVKADPEIQANALLTEMSSSLEFGKVYLKGNANATTINNDVLFPMLERIMNGADVKTELAQAQDAISMIIGQ